MTRRALAVRSLHRWSLIWLGFSCLATVMGDRALSAAGIVCSVVNRVGVVLLREIGD